jgi:hypothetical protein
VKSPPSAAGQYGKNLVDNLVLDILRTHPIAVLGGAVLES